MSMNEHEWMKCDDSEPMLDFLNAQASKRKLRLFACECARRVQSKADWMGDGEILLSERFAEGLASRRELRLARNQIGGIGSFSPAASASNLRSAILEEKAEISAQQAALCAGDFAYMVVFVSMNYVNNESSQAARADENKVQADLLREIFGNPFRPVAIDPAWPAWHDGIIVKIAQSIYDERAFANLPILADALEEAGCANAELLAHCRQPGPHVRGCWAVDLLIGKS